MLQRSAGSPDARPELADRLRTDGILWSTPEHPVLHRNGSTAPWMFYSWGVTSTADGLRLAARCLLDRLATFESTQIAGHGMTAMPLVSACVALGAGRYTGLAVRKERKSYLSGRQVEGVLDPTRPVVIVDDSLSSGTALWQAVSALEQAGATVEGAVALVGFPGRGGIEAASADGYRVEAILDITTDLGMPLYSKPVAMPDLCVDRAMQLPEGLAPAALARLVAGHVLRHRTAPAPPRTIAGRYDGGGGVFVSFRRREDDHRLARDGFWHFRSEEFSPAADVVAATVRTVRTCAGAVTVANLDQLKIGVTFLGPMEQIQPAALDFTRYAIVVTDPTGARAGGALPNSQVFTSEIEQYRHALERNAGMAPTEPHLLYRQTVAKDVEAGHPWPAYGAPDPPALAWASDDAVGRAVVGRAAAVVHGRTPTVELPAIMDAAQPDAAAVTVYRNGTLGVGIAWADDDVAEQRTAWAGAVTALVDRAAAIARHAAGSVPADATVMVHLLHEPERLGRCGAELAATKVRKGLDAIRCDRGDERAVLLPTALVYNSWSKREFVAEAARRVGGADSSTAYTTYRSASWVSTDGRARRIRSGFPALRTARPVGEPEIRALVGYTLRNLSRDGVPLYHLQPVTGRRVAAGTGPRQLHALLGVQRAAALLGEPDWAAAARQGLRTYLTAGPMAAGGFAVGSGGPLADAIAFAAMGAPEHPLARHPAVTDIGRRLTAMIRSTGVVSAQPIHLNQPQDMEYLPGAVLTALAVDPRLLRRIPAGWWPRIIEVHRQRFLVLRSWGQVGWQLQAWAGVHRCIPDDTTAGLVFEIADWALDRQLETTGAFLEILSPEEPSFNTGFIAEGIAAAWATAIRVGDAGRAARYRSSWQRAGDFVRTLLIGPDDLFCLRAGAAALGGVRLTPSRPDIRADSVSHWLNALVTGLTAERAGD